MKRHLFLTPALFCASIQEIVLRYRYGYLWSLLNSDYESESAISGNISGDWARREISFLTEIEFGNLSASIPVRGFYIQDKRICSIFSISKTENAIRDRSEANPREVNPTQFGAWLATLELGMQLDGIRLIYDVRSPRGHSTSANENWQLDRPLCSEGLMRAMVDARMAAIEEGLLLDDDKLPECTREERDGIRQPSYKKCGYCRAADVCHQYKKRLREEIEAGEELVAAFNSVGAIAETTKCWQKEAVSHE